jgi:hypothetical protein
MLQVFFKFKFEVLLIRIFVIFLPWKQDYEFSFLFSNKLLCLTLIYTIRQTAENNYAGRWTKRFTRIACWLGSGYNDSVRETTKNRKERNGSHNTTRIWRVVLYSVEENRVRFHSSLFGICSGWNGTGTNFSPSTSASLLGVIPPMFDPLFLHSTNAK